MFRAIGRLVLTLALCGAVRAEGITWMPVSYAALIQGSDLIVVGKLAATADTAHDDGWTACGTMVVAEVLKGSPPAGGVHLDYPSARPEAYGGAEAAPAPAEVVFEKGQQGIWFLSRPAGQTHYTAAHPARFKPLPFLARVKSEIARAGAH